MEKGWDEEEDGGNSKGRDKTEMPPELCVIVNGLYSNLYGLTDVNKILPEHHNTIWHEESKALAHHPS